MPMAAFFLLRQITLDQSSPVLCRSFIRQSVSFLVYHLKKFGWNPLSSFCNKKV